MQFCTTLFIDRKTKTDGSSVISYYLSRLDIYLKTELTKILKMKRNLKITLNLPEVEQ